LKQLVKYLRVKKRQAILALQILEFKVVDYQDLIAVAKLADTLASFNPRSKNRRKNFASEIKENVPRND